MKTFTFTDEELKLIIESFKQLKLDIEFDDRNSVGDWSYPHIERMNKLKEIDKMINLLEREQI